MKLAQPEGMCQVGGRAVFKEPHGYLLVWSKCPFETLCRFTIQFRSLFVWVLYIIEYVIVNHFILSTVFILVEHSCLIICLYHHCKINIRVL